MDRRLTLDFGWLRQQWQLESGGTEDENMFWTGQLCTDIYGETAIVSFPNEIPLC